MDGDYEVDSLGGLLAVATANANNIEVGAARVVLKCEGPARSGLGGRWAIPGTTQRSDHVRRPTAA